VDEAYDTGFIKRVEAVAAEAEEVALEIAGGKEITAREQQDLVWQSRTVSVWDLEQVGAGRAGRTHAYTSQTSFLSMSGGNAAPARHTYRHPFTQIR
jgi:hypothetical protein